jgi:hypothetical protein
VDIALAFVDIFLHGVQPPVIRFKISLAKVMIIPPAKVRKPFALCDGSCDLSDKPTCTIPKPSRISPIALIKPKSRVSAQRLTAFRR